MNVLKFLKQNVKPALGCTDPVTVGYGVAIAYHAIYESLPPVYSSKVPPVEPEFVKKITIHQDRDSYKNGIAIAIPGANGQKGNALAAALGLFMDPSKGFSLFEGVSDQNIEKAKQLIDSQKVIFKKNDDSSEIASIDVRIELEYLINDKLNHSMVRIQIKPDAISEINVNGEIIFERSPKSDMDEEEKIPEELKDLVEIVQKMSTGERDFVYEGLVMNKKIALEGLRGEYGLQLGRHYSDLVEKNILSSNIITHIKIMAAAAGDARMGGVNMPVMSTAGSGNQGITGLIPISVVGEELKIDKKKIVEAAMLVHLVTKFMLNQSAYLSAICGCAIKAGIGAAAGVTYLLGGNVDQIGNAINIMAANITGMICDGAKAGCALKLSTAAATATESAFLAISGLCVPTDNGILCVRPEDTIKKIGELSREMVSADVKIVEIMQEKQC